jgi:hypothetical protein
MKIAQKLMLGRKFPFLAQGGLCTKSRIRKFPALAKDGQGGVAATSRKWCEASFDGADGVVGSSPPIIR